MSSASALALAPSPAPAPRPVLRAVADPVVVLDDATGRERAGARGVLAQVGLLVVATLAYLAVRAVTQGDVQAAEANAQDLLRLERSLGLNWESWAQDRVLGHEAVVRTLNTVYVWAFWPFVAGALVVLYRRDRERYRLMRNAVFLSGAAGLVVFALLPVAPPRFLDGFTDTIASLSGQDGLAHPSGFTNEYAALPSFHVGWTVLAGVCLLPVLRHRAARVLALAHGGLMAVTVVCTANHYVVDVLAGTALSLGALGVVHLLHQRRAAADVDAALRTGTEVDGAAATTPSEAHEPVALTTTTGSATVLVLPRRAAPPATTGGRDGRGRIGSTDAGVGDEDDDAEDADADEDVCVDRRRPWVAQEALEHVALR